MKIKSRHKILKRLGKNLWNLPNDTFYRLSRKSRRKAASASIHCRLLRTKETVKKQYGSLTEKQFQHYFSKKSDAFIRLEKRLDVIVYRMNLSKSIFHSRYMITHGYIYVNSARITIPSFTVCKNDIIQVKHTYFKHLISNLVATSSTRTRSRRPYANRKRSNIAYGSIVPAYLEMNYKILSGIYLDISNIKDVPVGYYMNQSRIKLAF